MICFYERSPWLIVNVTNGDVKPDAKRRIQGHLDASLRPRKPAPQHEAPSAPDATTDAPASLS